MKPKSAAKSSPKKRTPNERNAISEFGGNQFSVINLALFDVRSSPPRSMISLSAILPRWNPQPSPNVSDVLGKS